MPNFSQEERRVLAGEELDLVVQTRQPQLKALPDAALNELVARLRILAAAQSQDEAAARRLLFLNAALRRARAEQKRRRASAPKAAPAPVSVAAGKARAARSPAGRGNRGQRVRGKTANAASDRRGSGGRKVAKGDPVQKPASAAQLPAGAPAKTVPKKPEKTAAKDVHEVGAIQADPAAARRLKKLTRKAAEYSTRAERAHKKLEKAIRKLSAGDDPKAADALERAERKARKASRKARRFCRRARAAASDPS
ncbi:MAG: hypothetical protein ACK5LJ_12890 [Paracoccus sp. (in: a-proteobacteria)]